MSAIFVFLKRITGVDRMHQYAHLSVYLRISFQQSVREY